MHELPTQSWCSANVFRQNPVPTSQIFIVLSRDAESRKSPDSENYTEDTECSCPISVRTQV